MITFLSLQVLLVQNPHSKNMRHYLKQSMNFAVLVYNGNKTINCYQLYLAYGVRKRSLRAYLQSIPVSY